MENAPGQRHVKHANQTALWVIWGFGLFSLATYFQLIHFVTPLARTTGNPLITLALGAVSGVLSLLVMFARPIFGKRVRFLVYSIIRWALALSIGIYGLILYMLGAPMNTAYAFMGCSLLLLTASLPLRAAENRLLRYQEGSK